MNNKNHNATSEPRERGSEVAIYGTIYGRTLMIKSRQPENQESTRDDEYVHLPFVNISIHH